MITMESVHGRERFLKKKYLPCIACFVLPCSAVFLVVAGAWVISKEKIHAAISSLPILTPAIILLIAGIICFLAACIGLFLVCCKEGANLSEMKNPLIAFLVLFAVASILALVAGGIGKNYATRLNDQYKADLYEKIRMYGITGRYEILAHFDSIQKEDACCGVMNYADWRNTVYAGSRYDKVPDSCCKVQEHACGFEFELSKINHKGCFAFGIDQMNTNLNLVGIGGLVVGVLEVILWISFLCLYLSETCSSNPHLKDRVQASYQRTEDAKSDHQFEHENEGCSSSTQATVKPSAQADDGPGTQGCDPQHNPETPSIAQAPKGSDKKKTSPGKHTSNV